MLRNKLDFVILIGVSLFVLPFVNTSRAIDPVLTLRFIIWAAVTLLLMAMLAIRLCWKSDSIDLTIMRRWIFVALLGYLIFSAVSLMKAVNISEGIYEVLKIFVSLVFLFISTIILCTDRKYTAILVKVIIVSAIILSAVGFYEYFRYFFHQPGICNIKGTMAQKNQYSSALFLMLPFCIYGAVTAKRYWKIISIVPAMSILGLILLNQTRSVWMAILVSISATTILIIMMIICGKMGLQKEANTKIVKRTVCVALLLVIVFTTFGYHYLQKNTTVSLTERVQSMFSPSHKNNAIRLAMWQKSLGIAKDNFALGVGAGNWKIMFPSEGIEDISDLPGKMYQKTFFVRPENDYIWVLMETGIAGFLFYIAIISLAIYYTLKIMILSSDAKDKLFSILLFFGLIGYMVFSGFTFPKERIFHSMFLMLMMAIVISMYHRLQPDIQSVSRKFVLWSSLPCVAILIFAVVVGSYRLNAEVHTKRAFAARRAKNWPMVIAEIDKGYSQWATLDPMSAPLKWYRGEANFLMNNIPQALEDFKSAYKSHPYHIHVLNNLATCYEMSGDHDKAITHYNAALQIYPIFEDALVNLGAAYYNAGRYIEAHQTLLKCKKKNKRAKQYLEAVEIKLGKMTE